MFASLDRPIDASFARRLQLLLLVLVSLVMVPLLARTFSLHAAPSAPTSEATAPEAERVPDTIVP